MTFPRATLFASVLAVAAVGLFSACGSSSKKDLTALCKEGCTKGIDLCFADAGVDTTSAKALCETSCANSTKTNGASCTNTDAIIAAYQLCQAKTECKMYQDCIEALPECMTTGAGGNSGRM